MTLVKLNFLKSKFCILFFSVALNTFFTTDSFGQSAVHAFLIASPNPDNLAISKFPRLKGERVTFADLSAQVTIDLDRMGKWLANSGFAKDQITTIDGNDLDVKKIKSSILSVISNLPKDALVLFYFTGHGLQMFDNKNGTDMEPDGLDEGLVLKNEIWIDDDINLFYEENMGRFRNVMIIDACYAGSTYKVWGPPTIRELLLQGSSKLLYDEHKSSEYFENDSCAPFITDKSVTKYAMLYFGAAGDTQQAKADHDGSWLTRNISLIVEDPDFIKDGTYRLLNCALHNMAKDGSLNFTPEYVEIGNVQSYNLTKPLK
jgi:hypothetical protein